MVLAIVGVLVVVGLIAAISQIKAPPFADYGLNDPSAPSSGSSGGSSDQSAAALAHDGAGGAPRAGGSLTYDVDNVLETFDPRTDRWGTAVMIEAQAVYDPLMAYNGAQQVSPYLAKSMTAAPDLLSWTIGLRPGVVFHDGTPCDAAAVKLALDEFRQHAYNAGSLALITDVTVTGPLEVVVHVAKPWATLPNALAGQAGLVAAKAVYDDPGGHTAIGTGPFVMGLFSADRLSMRKNPHYWQPGKPYLDSVVFDHADDTTDRMGALRSGRADITQFLGSSAGAENIDDLSVFTDAQENPGRDVLPLNTSKAPFDDEIARKAVAAGIDRQAIAGRAEVGYLGSSSPLFSDDPDAVQRYDPDRARALAKMYESAHGHPLSFELLTADDAVILVNEVKVQLARVGIAATIRTEPFLEQYQDMVAGRFEATYYLQFGGPSPEVDMVALIGGASPLLLGGGTLDFPRYADPELLKAVQQYRSTSNLAMQRVALASVQRLLADQAPWIFLPRGHQGSGDDPPGARGAGLRAPRRSAGLPERAAVRRLDLARRLRGRRRGRARPGRCRRGLSVRTYVRVCIRGDDPARRPRRLLRVGRAARRSSPPRQARHRGWGRGHGGQLRGQGVRDPRRHGRAAGAALLPERHRRAAAHARLQRGQQGGLRDLRATRRHWSRGSRSTRRSSTSAGCCASPGRRSRSPASCGRDVLDRVGLAITVGVATHQVPGQGSQRGRQARRSARRARRRASWPSCTHCPSSGCGASARSRRPSSTSVVC